MSPDIDSLIEECTRGGEYATLYMSRLGLLDLASTPVFQRFWNSTKPIVKSIATQYNSRNSIREALRKRRICLDQIARPCLKTFGHQIWGTGANASLVASVNTIAKTSGTPTVKRNSRGKNPSKPKALSQIAESAYSRHLIYEDPNDRRKIRLQVSAWIIERACRKVEAGGRTGKAPRRARVKALSKPASFIAAVHVDRNELTHSTALSSDDDVDELTMHYCASNSVGSKHKENFDPIRRPQPQQSAGARNLLQSGVERPKSKSIAVVVSPRKPWSTKTTRTAKGKPEGSEPRASGNPVAQSVSSTEEKTSMRPPQVSELHRTISHQITPAPADKQLLRNNTEAGLDSVSRQLLHDRSDLGIQLLSLLEYHDPGRHNLFEMKQILTLIDKIAAHDADGLIERRKGTREKYKRSLYQWLVCMRTLVDFREATGLEGDGPMLLAGFKNLPSEKKKKAQRPYSETYREILRWYEKDGFTIAAFSEEIGSMLLEMASFAPLGMELEDLLVDLVPLTTSLVECFGATPPSRAA